MKKEEVQVCQKELLNKGDAYNKKSFGWKNVEKTTPCLLEKKD